MKAASVAHKPSLSRSPEQQKTSPAHALKAASAADRDSSVQKSTSPTYSRNPEESARIQRLAHELAQRELLQNDTAPGGVRRSDLTRVATLTMQRKTAADLAEQEKEESRKRQVQEEAMAEWNNREELDDAARRIVAERIARVTLTGEEGDEVLAGKAAGASINRGNQRVSDWMKVLKSLEDENKSDKEKNMGWLRQSMRRSAPIQPSKNDPAVIMAAAQRNVKTQLDGMDRSIQQEWLVLGKPQAENLARQNAATKDLEEKGTVDLERRQKERASNFPPLKHSSADLTSGRHVRHWRHDHDARTSRSHSPKTRQRSPRRNQRKSRTRKRTYRKRTRRT